MDELLIWRGTSLDLSTVDQFTEQIRSSISEGTDLVVSLEPMEFVDSTGVRAMVGLKAEFARSGRSLRFVGLRQEILDIFEIMGITDLVIEDDKRQQDRPEQCRY